MDIFVAIDASRLALFENARLHNDSLHVPQASLSTVLSSSNVFRGLAKDSKKSECAWLLRQQ
eukprot:2582398-Pleurochrysis_carterae.AAC.1